MTGNSMGEVAGPLFGAALHALGGLRLPYVGAALLCSLTSLAFVATAAAGDGGCTPEDAAAGGTEGGGAGGCTVPARVQPWGGALRDAPTWRLCAFQALACGAVRSCLDILLPLWLRTRRGLSQEGVDR